MTERLTFFRLRNMHKVYGFGDRCIDSPLMGSSLDQRQKEAVASAGGILKDVRSEEEISDNSYFLFSENTYFTPSVAEYMQSQALRLNRSFRIKLEDNRFNERYVLPSQGNENDPRDFRVLYRNRQSPTLQDNVLPQKVYANGTRVPSQIVKGGLYHTDQCDSYIASVDTPFHLLQLNMALNVNRNLWLRRLVPRAIEKDMGHMNTRLYYFGLRRTNKIGKRCKIHPTAVLEGVVLGDDVTVGAYAIVRLSTVGSGSTIDDQSSVINSVLGENNFIANKNHVMFCMTYDDVFLIHGPYQFSIFGQGVAVFATINCDIRMDQKTIRIEGHRGLMDSHQPLLGVAYGHRAKVAGGNVIAPGRIIPNDHIENPPEFIIS